MRDIAIIGAGAAGCMVAAELLRHARPGALRLHWWRGTHHAGRGVAYATAANEHLLNVRSAGLGLCADAPGEFFDTLRAADPAARASDFVPRRLYGDYLEAATRRSLAEAQAQGHRVHLIDADATCLRRDAHERWRIGDGADGDTAVDDVVLALGATTPCVLPVVHADALASGRYARDPWQWPRLKQAPRHVLAIGSGLTAVDALLSAARQWPQAQLTAISRHGCLPREHIAEPAQPYAHQASLHEALLERPQVRHWLRTILHTLRHEPDLDWRALIDGLRTATPALWSALHADERQRFLRHVRWLWEAVRHRMPPASAQRIGELRAHDRLRVIAGNVHDVSGSDPLVVYWRPRGRRRPERMEADLVIQATGLGTDLRHTDHALLRQLVDEGLAGVDALGLGLAARADGQVLRADGTPLPRVHALGSLLRGAAWECSGLPEIRAAARRFAIALAATPTSGHKQIVGGQFAAAAP